MGLYWVIWSINNVHREINSQRYSNCISIEIKRNDLFPFAIFKKVGKIPNIILIVDLHATNVTRFGYVRTCYVSSSLRSLSLNSRSSVVNKCPFRIEILPASNLCRCTFLFFFPYLFCPRFSAIIPSLSRIPSLPYFSNRSHDTFIRVTSFRFIFACIFKGNRLSGVITYETRVNRPCIIKERWEAKMRSSFRRRAGPICLANEEEEEEEEDRYLVDKSYLAKPKCHRTPDSISLDDKKYARTTSMRSFWKVFHRTKKAKCDRKKLLRR